MSNYLLITLQKISVQRQTSLGAMFAYNKSDWTYGWMAAFDGFTIFYSEPHEETIGMVHNILCFATHES